MRIIVGNQEVPLLDRDVKLARKMIMNFLDSVKKHGNENEAPTIYLTTLILMHLMSKNQIDAITPETMKLFLEANANGTGTHHE